MFLKNSEIKLFILIIFISLFIFIQLQTSCQTQPLKKIKLLCITTFCVSPNIFIKKMPPFHFLYHVALHVSHSWHGGRPWCPLTRWQWTTSMTTSQTPGTIRTRSRASGPTMNPEGQSSHTSDSSRKCISVKGSEA